MSEATNKPAIWFWVIAVLALLWNAMGGWDFYNSITLNEEYLSEFPGYLEFIRGMPIWAKSAWGLAIFCAIGGSVLLLLRKALAYPVFILGLLGMFVSFGYQFTAANHPEGTTMTNVFTGLIFVLAFFFTWFARMAKNKNWLK